MLLYLTLIILDYNQMKYIYIYIQKIIIKQELRNG